MKIIPAVILTTIAHGLLPVNTMGKKMTPTVTMMSALTPTRVAIPTIVERRKSAQFFLCKITT